MSDKFIDTLSDARAYHEKEYQWEKAHISNGGSEIAAGRSRRYADAIAEAALRLGQPDARIIPLIEALSAAADKIIDFIPQLPKALHSEAFEAVNAARAAIRATAK